MMSRVAKEYIADQTQLVYDHVHATFVKRRKAFARASIARHGQLPDENTLNAMNRLDDQTNDLARWNRKPADKKFTVESVTVYQATPLLDTKLNKFKRCFGLSDSKDLAWALGCEELPRTSLTKVTTYSRLSAALVNIALQREEMDASLSSANTKWLQAQAREGEQPGVSNFNLAAKATSPWALYLASIITHLRASKKYGPASFL